MEIALTAPLIRYSDQQLAVGSIERLEPELIGTGGQSPWVRTGVVKVMAIALLVGTGGEATGNFFLQRGQIGYGFPTIRYASRNAEAIEESENAPTTREMLEAVKAGLKLSVTELADALRVSRQTVYSWQDGKAISTANNDHLAGLYALSEGLAKVKPDWTRHELRRKLPEIGGTVFDGIVSGRSASELVAVLTATLAAEQGRRTTLKERLSKRQKKPLDDAEFGALDFDDRG